MSCQDIENQGCFPEGNTTYHDYSFKDKDGNDIILAEKIEYSLGDNIDILIPFTEIGSLVAPGELKVSADDNIIKSNGSTVRLLTFIVTHNGGDKIQKTIKYELQNSLNI